jgi:hypothetical protein
MERVAAAKKIIENGYRERTKNLRERNERYHHQSTAAPSSVPKFVPLLASFRFRPVWCG